MEDVVDKDYKVMISFAEESLCLGIKVYKLLHYSNNSNTEKKMLSKKPRFRINFSM